MQVDDEAQQHTGQSDPPACDLFHAMDRVILDIAVEHNGGGALRVPDLGQSLWAGVYFAPGINGNPLVPSANPFDIARRVSIGLYDLATMGGILGFAISLLRARLIGPDDFLHVKGRRPTRQPVIIRSGTARIAATYRPLDDNGLYASEFVSAPEESVPWQSYELVVEERFEFRDRALGHSLVVN